MFISFSVFDASLVWRRFLHSLGRVSSPGQTDRLHTSRHRSSLSYWVYHYDTVIDGLFNQVPYYLYKIKYDVSFYKQ